MNSLGLCNAGNEIELKTAIATSLIESAAAKKEKTITQLLSLSSSAKREREVIDLTREISGDDSAINEPPRKKMKSERGEAASSSSSSSSSTTASQRKSCLRKGKEIAPSDEVTTEIRKHCEELIKKPVDATRGNLLFLAGKDGKKKRLNDPEKKLQRVINMYLAGNMSDGKVAKKTLDEVQGKIRFAANAEHITWDHHESPEKSKGTSTNKREKTKQDRGVSGEMAKKQSGLSFDELARYADENCCIFLQHLFDALDLYVLAHASTHTSRMVKNALGPTFACALQEYKEQANDAQLTLEGFQAHFLHSVELQKTKTEAESEEDGIYSKKDYGLSFAEKTIASLFQDASLKKVLEKYFEQQNSSTK